MPHTQLADRYSRIRRRTGTRRGEAFGSIRAQVLIKMLAVLFDELSTLSGKNIWGRQPAEIHPIYSDFPCQHHMSTADGPHDYCRDEQGRPMACRIDSWIPGAILVIHTQPKWNTREKEKAVA